MYYSIHMYICNGFRNKLPIKATFTPPSSTHRSISSPRYSSPIPLILYFIRIPPRSDFQHHQSIQTLIHIHPSICDNLENLSLCKNVQKYSERYRNNKAHRWLCTKIVAVCPLPSNYSRTHLKYSPYWSITWIAQELIIFLPLVLLSFWCCLEG